MNDGDARRRLRLSILDQSPIAEGSSGVDALRNTLDLARLGERLGYHRYWVAEHHGTPGLAGASPEVLIAAIAGATSRMRVGSGGVMLPHYSPLKVAETFSMLSGLYPGRIDLGIGRAAGTDPTTTFALQRDRRQRAPDDFPHQLAELMAYIENELPADHPFARLARTLPGLPERPELWLLGSSPQSGIWASQLGLPYAFADFINPAGAAIAARYRQEFVASPRLASPRVTVCAWALCAASDQEAERLSASHRMMMTLLLRNQLVAVPPVETALRFLEEEERSGASHGGLPLAQLRARRAIVGAPDTVRAGIEAVAHEYGADEVMVVTITHDHEVRRRSYELIAEAFALREAAAEVEAQAV
ncbi:MAG TPA: LLM class flavin-dependent oxidoreductase [Gemmatimonadaceae bacterium]|nr:LLM class flavin-dependent oxidoreductase [Gemmatimonadaceae bacterium]